MAIPAYIPRHRSDPRGSDEAVPQGATNMKTVRDIFVEALALKRQGLDPRQIADRIVDIGHDSGFVTISEHGVSGSEQPTTIELVFPNREVIYFDGADWHHRRP